MWSTSINQLKLLTANMVSSYWVSTLAGKPLLHGQKNFSLKKYLTNLGKYLQTPCTYMLVCKYKLSLKSNFKNAL